jgi:hypothetical protein
LQPSFFLAISRLAIQCFKQSPRITIGSPHFMQRPSRLIRN